MATTVLGLKTFAASDPVDYNEINDNYNKIDTGVKTALQGRAAHNWLHNSYFRIAQAGYGGMHGTQKYACDRWYDTYGFGSFSFDESQGLTIAYGTNHAYLAQKIDGASLLHGKSVTLACQLSDGTVYANSGVFNSSGASFQIAVDSGKTFTLYYDRAEFVVTSGSLTVKWAALYEGSYTANTLPAYQPKGYAAELAECQLYNREEYVVPITRIRNNVFSIGTIIQMRDMGELKPTITLKKFTRPSVIDILQFAGGDKIDIENLGEGRNLLMNAILTSCQDYEGGYLMFSINADL